MSRKLLTVAGAVLFLQIALACLHAQESPDQARLLNNLRNLRSDLEQNPDYILEREYFSAIGHLVRAGDRPGCLEACQEFLKKHPESQFTVPMQGLVDSLQREAQRPPPAALAIPEADRTLEQRIECLIFVLRDINAQPHSTPGSPVLLERLYGTSIFPVNSYTQIFDIGEPAIPYLIAALEDDAPTRTTDFGGMFSRKPFVWRRQDLAMKCLEAITACRFFGPGYDRIELHMDTPERRQAVIDNVRKWRELSAGKTQVESIRIQLELCRSNPTVRDQERREMLETLGKIAGPQEVLAELGEMEHSIFVRSTSDEIRDPERSILASSVSGVRYLRQQFDHPRYVQAVFREFWENPSWSGDYTTLLRYGDRKVFEEIGRRLEATGKLDPVNWQWDRHIQEMSKYGREWSIPILGQLLAFTENKTSRQVGDASQEISWADLAVEPFQELSGFHARYLKEDSREDRMKAISRAREWWLTDGKENLKAKILVDRPPREDLGDLLLDERGRAMLELKLLSSNSEIRQRAVSELSLVRSWTTRNALWEALSVESVPAERQRTLKVLRAFPVAWELEPALECFLQEPDLETQLQAGELLHQTWLAGRSWQLRLELRDDARKRLENYQIEKFLDGSGPPAAVSEQLEKILKN